MLGIIVPKCVNADEVLAEEVKYYKTVYKNNLFGIAANILEKSIVKIK